MHASATLWFGFNLFIVIALILDLYVIHRNSKVVTIKNAFYMSMIWIGIALLFNYGIYLYIGRDAALNFFTGYLIEKSLSVDNLFIFILLFKTFRTPPQYQHKILFWGIIGAIFMRAAMIFSGIALINKFHWMFYLFGTFLIYSGITMLFNKEKDPETTTPPRILTWIQKYIPMSHEYDSNRFFTKQSSHWVATPLFGVLLAIEITDLIFALDSIPAIIAITQDPFIIYTSNIFAILGLRSLYFVLAGMADLFHYLHYGLAAILIFVGSKMLVESYIDVPITIALGFIVIALTISIGASLLFPSTKVHK